MEKAHYPFHTPEKDYQRKQAFNEKKKECAPSNFFKDISEFFDAAKVRECDGVIPDNATYVYFFFQVIFSPKKIG